MEFLSTIVDWTRGLHTPAGISHLVAVGGFYALIFIIFAETGLLLGFFLPGDSLLITAGVLANPANPNYVSTLNIVTLNIVLALAAVIGQQLGFFLGRKVGDKMWSKPDGVLYKKKHLQAAHDFYERHGSISLVAARYIPIIRTFVPFVAGMARMSPKVFMTWNLVGGVLWITSLVWIGYFLGQTQLANRLDKIILVVIFVSVLPMFAGALRGLSKKRKKS